MDPSSDRGLHLASTDVSEWIFTPYSELATMTRRSAWQLREAGVTAGDVVAVARSAGPEFVADFFGALLIGATPAPVAPPVALGEENRYLKKARQVFVSAGARVVTGTETVGRRLRPIADELSVRILTDTTAATPLSDAGPQTPEIALIQHSSGSTTAPKGVRIPFRSLQASVTAMRHWLELETTDSFSTWLPMHHDMGLVGTLLLPLDSGLDIWMMRPEQFVQSPARWVRSFSPGQGTVTATPNLGLAHVVRRMRPADLEGLDLTGWRTAVVGAERIDHDVIRSFTDLLSPCGLRPDVLVPAYGMAEATLAITGRRAGSPMRSVTVDPSSLTMGGAVRVTTDEAVGTTLVSCGEPLDGMSVQLRGEAGEALGDDTLGEIEVSGVSIAAGYTGGTGGSAITADGTLTTGDAGFRHDGELYVVGRLGDSIKQFGRWFFAEDIEQRAAAVSPYPTRTVALVGGLQGRNTAVVLMEREPSPASAQRIGAAVMRHLNDIRVLVLGVPVGTIMRTTSGKPMRRAMWRRLVDDDIETRVWWDSGDPAAVPAGAAETGGRTEPARL
ncbi:AMP-binding protein [Paractinoplanes ferrugineus]|uniref:AMP-binding protein n=1 Tax=Paractinoplanes ferrugineus TaxID=113564 RepID=UPI0023B331F2